MGNPIFKLKTTIITFIITLQLRVTGCSISHSCFFSFHFDLAGQNIFDFILIWLAFHFILIWLILIWLDKMCFISSGQNVFFIILIWLVFHFIFIWLVLIWLDKMCCSKKEAELGRRMFFPKVNIGRVKTISSSLNIFLGDCCTK